MDKRHKQAFAQKETYKYMANKHTKGFPIQYF